MALAKWIAASGDENARRASGLNSHLCVRIFFFIPRCHEKELIAVFKLPTRNAREIAIIIFSFIFVTLRSRSSLGFSLAGYSKYTARLNIVISA